MIHREDIERYPGTLAQLANDVGDLRYDALASFLRSLAEKLQTDGAADLSRLKAEDLGSRAGQRTDVRNLSRRAHKVAGLHRCAQFLRRLLQVVF